MTGEHIALTLGVRGVVSSGIGRDAQGTPIIRVLVDRATFDPRTIPQTMDGLRVEIQYSPPAKLLHAPHTQRVRPLQPGGSCNSDLASLRNSAGSIGGLVVSGDRALLVSCNHVLAGNDPAAVGQPIFQPARADGGTEAVATVSHFDPLEVGIANRRDCAVAGVFQGMAVDPMPLDFTLAPSGVFRVPSVGVTVFKSGRTTGFTLGLVAETDVVVNVDFGPGLGIISWTGTVRVTGSPFILGGDSGSWAFDAPMTMAGMVFAGDEFGSGWLINPVEVGTYIAERLGLAPAGATRSLWVPALVVVGVLALAGAGRK